MPWLEDLVTLVTNAQVGTFNTDLFTSTVASVPQLPDGTCVITETSGGPPERTHNSVKTPAYIHVSAQFMIRAATSKRARELARAYYLAVCGVRNTVINGGFYREINPMQEPYELVGPDERRDRRYVFNVWAVRRPDIYIGPYNKMVLANAPWGYWRLNDGPDTFLDSSVNGPGLAIGFGDGETVGVPGLITGGNLALSFAQFPVDIPPTGPLVGNFFITNLGFPTLVDEITVEAWYLPNDLPFDTGSDPVNAAPIVASNAMQLLQRIDGRFAFQTAGPDATSSILSTTFGSVGVRYHLVGVRSLAGRRLYVNGVLEASDENIADWGFDVSSHLRIGNQRGGSNFALGVIDEVAIYTTALDAAAVKLHWLSGTQ